MCDERYQVRRAIGDASRVLALPGRWSARVRDGDCMQRKSQRVVRVVSISFVAGTLLAAQSMMGQSAGDSNARPPVTQADVKIVERAQQILSDPSKWNRADNRVCPADARTFSLYCALEMATDEVGGKFEHRGAAMQEARFVIDDIAPRARSYDHRLMGFNNDPRTTFADTQKFFRVLEDRIAKRVAKETTGGK
jgi:hypothetical protein